MLKRLALAGVLLLTFSAGRSVHASDKVDLGGIILTVSDGWTAQVFHIVDQLSLWDEHAHRGYSRWASRTSLLNEEDRRLLQQHAELRKSRGWGNGFEQAFYVDDSIEHAAQVAVDTKLLSESEASAERDILLHFSGILSAFRPKSAAQVSALKQRLNREVPRLRTLVTQLGRFAEQSQPSPVPAFLIFNPEEGSGGGGYNGLKLVVEAQADPDALSILIHESFHALLRSHRGAIEEAAKAAGLSAGVMEDGIAYALAPGLTDAHDGQDPLAVILVRGVLRGTPRTDSYLQKISAAMVFRPILQDALARRQTITTVLPKLVAAWERLPSVPAK